MYIYYYRARKWYTFDLLGATSKHSSSSSSGGSCFDVDICPDLLLAGVALFAAAAFYTLYVAITMAGKKRRRRRRRAPGLERVLDVVSAGTVQTNIDTEIDETHHRIDQQRARMT